MFLNEKTGVLYEGLNAFEQNKRVESSNSSKYELVTIPLCGFEP